jgi:hypothetical protein
MRWSMYIPAQDRQAAKLGVARHPGQQWLREIPQARIVRTIPGIRYVDMLDERCER